MVIPRLLTWLDASPLHFGLLAWAGFLALLAAAVLPMADQGKRGGAWWNRPWLFGAAIVLCTVAFHWPSVLDNQELGDPDESQLTAAGITLGHDPLYFRSVDGATCGPVGEIPLGALASLGVRMDYRVAHAAALALSLAAVLATWLTLRHLFGESAGRLGILPLATAFAFFDFNQFLHYSTEQCPAALVAIACLCMARAWDPSGRLERTRWLAVCGVALGAVPFAKLQGGPIALYVALGVTILVAATGSALGRSRMRAVGFLAAGCLLVPAVLLLGIWQWGQFGEFQRSYLQANVLYLSGRLFPWSGAPAHFYTLVHLASGLEAFLLPSLIVAGLMVLWVRPDLRLWKHRFAIFSLLLVLVSTASAMAPGRNVFHYLHFVFFPAALCMGCFFGVVWDSLGVGGFPAGKRPWLPPALALLVIGVGVVPLVAWRIRAPYPYAGLYTAGRSVLAIPEAAREVMRHSRTSDGLAIWGWTPHLWVETGMWQATRDGNTIRQVEAGALQDTFLRRFHNDLVRNRPPVFVDSVGPGNFMADRASGGHEHYPAIRDYIASQYRLVREIDGMRIYVRRDLP